MYNIIVTGLFVIMCVGVDTYPNFVLFLTDDQDILLDGMVPMDKTLKLIGNHGMTFSNAFVNSPICCPSRSTILTGRYAHNTGVTNNSISGNCSSPHWQQHFESDTIASILKTSLNYTTFYAGKYLNQYGSTAAGGTKHVPKGYDWWIGLKGNSKYYNYTLSLNGTSKFFRNEYLTDVIKKYSIDFLNNINKTRPFFMTLSPPAPHAPFTPAPRHLHKFNNTTAVRTPAFNYSSYGKHWIVGMPPKHLPANVQILDNIQKGRLRTLLAVDEMVSSVIRKLKKLGVYNNTYLLFMSDNGYHIGQFGQPWDKRQPYETDIRIPFLISGPNVKKKSLSHFPISAVDVAPTVFDLAGLNIPNAMDGASFKFALNVEVDIFDKYVLIEYWGEGNSKSIDPTCPWKGNDLSQCSTNSWCKCQDARNNTYTCIIRASTAETLKYCQFHDAENFVEAYNLNIDKYELHNVFGNMETTDLEYYNNVLQKLKRCYCVATVIGDVNMSWGGTAEPAAQATLMSIGALGVSENKKHAKAIFEIITTELGIPDDRLYIAFTNTPTSDVGYSGTTFHDIFGS